MRRISRRHPSARVLALVPLLIGTSSVAAVSRKPPLRIEVRAPARPEVSFRAFPAGGKLWRVLPWVDNTKSPLMRPGTVSVPAPGPVAVTARDSTRGNGRVVFWADPADGPVVFEATGSGALDVVVWSSHNGSAQQPMRAHGRRVVVQGVGAALTLDAK